MKGSPKFRDSQEPKTTGGANVPRQPTTQTGHQIHSAAGGLRVVLTPAALSTCCAAVANLGSQCAQLRIVSPSPPPDATCGEPQGKALPWRRKAVESATERKRPPHRVGELVDDDRGDLDTAAAELHYLTHQVRPVPAASPSGYEDGHGSGGGGGGGSGGRRQR